MKIKHFLFFTLLVFLSISCQKDRIYQEQNDQDFHEVQQFDTRQNDSPCGEITELCYPFRAEIIPAPYIPFPKVLSLSQGGEFVNVYYMEAKNFFVERGDERFVLTNETSKYAKSKEDKSISELPSWLHSIVDLPEEDLSDGKISLDEASAFFGSDLISASERGDGSLDVIEMNESGGNEGPRLSYIVDFCEWVVVRTVFRYDEYIMSNLDPIIPGGASGNWYQEMENAIRACEADPCTDCPDSHCVITTFANDSNIYPAGLKNEIYAEYLRLKLDLTQEEVDWLLANPETLVSFLEYYDLNLSGEADQRNEDCIAGACGVPRADGLYVDLLVQGEVVSDDDRLNLESFYNTLYCEDLELYEELDYVIVDVVNGCIDEEDVLQCFEDEFLVNYSEDAVALKFAVAGYRICKKAYKVYKKLVKQNQLTPQKFKDGLTDAGISELLEIADALYTIFGASSTGWERVKAAVELVSGFDVSKKNAISQKVAQWGDQDVGSYFWPNFRKRTDDTFDGIYVGKGPIERGKRSGVIRSNANDSYHDGSLKFTKAYYNKDVDQSPDAAALKEEMIQMWDEGWNPLNSPGSQPAKFYNGARSPGFSKMNQDGF